MIRYSGSATDLSNHLVRRHNEALCFILILYYLKSFHSELIHSTESSGGFLPFIFVFSVVLICVINESAIFILFSVLEGFAKLINCGVGLRS